MVKTLLAVIQQVAGELAQNMPSSVLSATDRSSQQFKALAVAACEELADMHDWQFLTKTHTINTQAGVTAYALPVDCLRILSRSIYDNTGSISLVGSTSAATWSTLSGSGSSLGGNFRIVGNKIVFANVPGATSQKYTFDYITRNYVYDSGLGILKPEFTADSDKTVFNDRLLTNFIKLKWREAQGMETSPEVQAFNTSLSAAKASDRPAPIINLDSSFAFGEFSSATGSSNGSGATPTPTPTPTPDPIPVPGPGGTPAPPPTTVAVLGVSLAAPTTDKTSYRAGDTMNISGNIVVTGAATTANFVKLIAIGPGANHQSGPFSVIAVEQNVPLAVGTKTVSGLFQVTSSQAIGQWELYLSWTDTNGIQRDGPSTFVAITVPAALVVPIPLPTRLLGTYFTLWGGAFRITDVPTYYNQINLFHAVPSGTSGAFRFDYGNNVNAAEIATCRARGQRVVMTVGGANNGFNFQTRAQSTAFVESFKQIYASLGALDGCDFNNFEQFVGSSGVEMAWMGNQLKAFYGQNFSISAPPHPAEHYAPNDWAIMKTMLDAGALDYAAPQFYDSTELTGTNTVISYINNWVAHFNGDASKVVVGLGSNYAAGTTTAQAVEIFDSLKTLHPTLRGIYGWSSQTDQAANWSWGNTLKDHLGASVIAQTPWHYPTVTGGSGWVTPNNVMLSDNARTTHVVAANTESGPLSFWGFQNAGTPLLTSIPAGATIRGIELRGEGAKTTGDYGYSYIFLTQAGSFLPRRSTLSRGFEPTATEAMYSMGSPSDLWGAVDTNNDNISDRAWVRADFDALFGANAVFAAGPAGATFSMDSFSLRVFYTTGA